MFLTALFQRLHHFFRQYICKRTGLVLSGNDMIHCSDGTFRIQDSEMAIAQHRKRLGTGDFMDQVQTNEKLSLS